MLSLPVLFVMIPPFEAFKNFTASFERTPMLAGCHWTEQTFACGPMMYSLVPSKITIALK